MDGRDRTRNTYYVFAREGLMQREKSGRTAAAAAGIASPSGFDQQMAQELGFSSMLMLRM
jgi:hypothetical protein